MTRSLRRYCAQSFSRPFLGSSTKKGEGKATSPFFVLGTRTFGRNLALCAVRFRIDVAAEDVNFPPVAARVLDPHFVLQRIAARASHFVLGLVAGCLQSRFSCSHLLERRHPN